MFTFTGRMGRLAYFITWLACSALLAVPGFFFWNAQTIPAFVTPTGVFWLLGWAFLIVGFAWLWAATVRRLHDMDFSGFWCVIVYLVPITMLVLWLWPGTPGYNRYGRPY